MRNRGSAPERGDVFCVEWVGMEFLAVTSSGAFASDDGLIWKARDGKLPKQIRRDGLWLYGYG